MPVNRSVETCLICNCPIPELGGREVALGQLPGYGRLAGYVHPCCRDAGKTMVSGTSSPDGVWQIENVNGRCEDAPCCGCCGEVRIR